MRYALPLAALVLAGCAQVRELAAPPQLTAVRAELVDEIPPPEVPPRIAGAPATVHASTWRPAKANLFADAVALSPGDVLTVLIAIDDNAKLDNRSDRERSVSRSLNGDGTANSPVLTGSVSGDAALGSSTAFDGKGGTARSERIRLSLAATVVERLPNGNLMIDGRQEVRVNDELRVLEIAGIVRPSDIGPDNTIAYERIAEARIAYGGRGPVAEVQRPPYGQRILDHLLPF